MTGVPTNDVFCVLPWLHLCGSVDGVWGRCCVDSAMYHDELYSRTEEPEFALKDDALGCLPQSRYAADNPDRVFGIEDAFNSPNIRRTRLAMLAGDRVDACSYCYAREAGGGESYRQKAAGMVPEADVAALIAATAADGSLTGFPSYLDLRLGNSCNLKCVMCGYPVSSRWGLDRHPSWAPAHFDPYRDDEELWAALRRNAHTLRRVYFAGGEPFMQPGHSRLLDLLIETGSAGQIHLTYHSNMTMLPTGLFDKLARFAKVEIGASCDGTGPLFERIRAGAVWDVFVRNLRVAKRHVTVWLSVAPQRDNVLHLGEIIEFAEAEGIRVDLTNFVHWPVHLSVANLPEHDKRAAAAYLIRLIRHCRARGQDEAATHLEMLRDFVGRPPIPQDVPPQGPATAAANGAGDEGVNR